MSRLKCLFSSYLYADYGTFLMVYETYHKRQGRHRSKLLRKRLYTPRDQDDNAYIFSILCTLCYGQTYKIKHIHLMADCCMVFSLSVSVYHSPFLSSLLNFFLFHHFCFDSHKQYSLWKNESAQAANMVNSSIYQDTFYRQE